ncbi:MAG: hypothetical protein RLZZ336_1328 [Cyanobacteriota bacterium]|jgi:hypothetical protein
MVFNRKASFFLDLGSEGAKPAQVAVAAEQPKATPKAAPSAVQAGTTAAATAASQPAAASTAPSLTTAEAIAAELRAAQEARPPVSNATFAPEALNPANAVPSRRRRAGANLAGFKGMASSMLGTAKS